MASEPSEDAVQSFCGLSGLPRSNAIRWLKANSNDANNAAIAWIDGGQADLPPPPRNNDTYDEQLWHADRDGTMPKSQMEASGFGDRVPPTRPSSRVDSMRPIFGPENNPNISRPENYDRDLQRAKEMSLTESQTLPPQETGVTYDNQYFGPPTQTSYDSEKWAMTVAESNTQEILLNPEPPDRGRSPGAPAFLKPTSTSSGLGAFLVILHSIPLAREALLNREILINDYGRGSDWWDGSPIRSLRVVNVDEDGRGPPPDDLVYETQRLMAFLDGTERAYGSADALVGLPSFMRSADGLITSFLATWTIATKACFEEPLLSNIFQSRGIIRPKDSSLPAKNESMYCFILDLKSKDLVGKGFSLYEAIDEFVAENSKDSDTFLDELGDVFMFDITNFVDVGQNLGISIPPIWYADRYLETSIELVAQIRAEKEGAKKSIQDLEIRRDILSTYKKPGSTSTENVGTLMGVVEEYIIDNLAEARATESSEDITRYRVILEQISGLLKGVTSELDEVNKLEDGEQDRILQISNRLKEPSEDPKLSPKHKYFLKGVILKSNSFYVLESVDKEGEASESISPSVPGHQWWRIEYNSTSVSPVQTTKVTEKEVLDAASMDAKSVYLVYASEKALAYENQPLPTQLQNFVRADNLAFQAELDQYQTQKDQEMSWEKGNAQDFSNQQPPWDDTSQRQHWAGPIETSDFPAALSPQKRKAKEAAEDSDMEVEHDDSPTMQSDEDGFISSDSSPLDPHPFERASMRYGSDTNPPMQQRLRPLEPKPPAMGLNGRLPATLQQYDDQEMEEIKRN